MTGGGRLRGTKSVLRPRETTIGVSTNLPAPVSVGYSGFGNIAQCSFAIRPHSGFEREGRREGLTSAILTLGWLPCPNFTMRSDQLYFLRPGPGWAKYRTPIGGLYVCGSGTHPGGGVMGAPGHNAAREILKDWRKTARRA
jgi:hypothetical protein